MTDDFYCCPECGHAMTRDEPFTTAASRNRWTCARCGTRVDVFPPTTAGQVPTVIVYGKERMSRDGTRA